MQKRFDRTAENKSENNFTVGLKALMRNVYTFKQLNHLEYNVTNVFWSNSVTGPTLQILILIFSKLPLFCINYIFTRMYKFLFSYYCFTGFVLYIYPFVWLLLKKCNLLLFYLFNSSASLVSQPWLVNIIIVETFASK